MKISVFQPPYPKAGTITGAEECLDWIRAKLDGLEPGDQDLVLLPEYATAPGLDDQQMMREFVKSRGADLLQAVATAARRLHSLIVLASPALSGAHWFNRTFVFDATGNLVFTYDKIHLTDAERDDLGFTPGARLTVFQHNEIRIGFATCFDIYFPEHLETLAAQGADIVLCPSYQRSESAERISLLARTRAFDSGTYVIRSSYSMGNTAVGGRSLVATPSGVLLADAGSDACVLRAELNPKHKFVKPASHGRQAVEHRSLIESHRRPATYRESTTRSQQLKSSPFPRLCAHRGLSHACPENTLPAFAAAISCGADEMEFDLRSSRDGVLVICHDESVDRTTDGTGRVVELTWREICNMDAGIRFGEEWKGIRMPRLEEVLDLTDHRIGLNIHIKDAGPDGSTIKRVCDLLIERALLDVAYIALDTESALRIALEYAPDVSRACLVAQNDPSRSIAIAQQYACQRIQFSRRVTKQQIEQARDVGLICNLFWSDDPQEAVAYVQNGIDVILTNKAHMLIAGGFRAFRLGFG